MCEFENVNDLGEVHKRPGQPIDDDYIDPAGLDVLEQVLERRAVHSSARDAAVVICRIGAP